MTQEIESPALTQRDLNEALLAKFLENQGFRYVLEVGENNSKVLKVVLRDPEVSNKVFLLEDSSSAKNEEGPVIEVPRDPGVELVGKTSTGKVLCGANKYRRTRTDPSILKIDEEYDYPSVRELVRLRENKTSSSEKTHEIKKHSIALGTENFVLNTLSYKESIVLLNLAQDELKTRSVAKQIEWIKSNYNIGYLKDGSLYLFLIKIKSLVMNSDAYHRFVSGESINMSYSLNFFKELNQVNNK